MKNIIYYTLLFSLLLISCDMETVIDLDIPPHEPVLVLNGLLDTDTNARVVISHSVGAFSNTVPSFINNANVLLYKGDQFIDSLLPDMINLIHVHYTDDNYNTGSLPMYYYKSDYIPEKNTTYRVDVGHSDYTSISAETFIPDDMALYNIDTAFNEYNIRLRFTFDDDPNKQNYYRLKLSSSCKWEYEGEKGDEDFNPLCMMSNDPSFGSGGPSGEYAFVGNNITFSDDLFNGQQKTISLDIDICKFDDEFDEKITCDTIIIEFATFGGDTYSYYTSLGDHSEKGELGLFGGEVIPVYSNVENGLGVLISVNAQNIQLKP